MADINRVELFGRFSADVEIQPGPSSRELTVFSMATDIGYFDKEQDARSPNLQWHYCFTYQHGPVRILKEHGRKGARAIVVGQLEYRNWRRDGEDTDRTKVEIMIGFKGTVNFVDHDRAAEINRPD
jgi:single-strand DNA-binding protein